MPIINTVIQGGGSASTKYNANVDAFLGNLDSNGILQNPTDATDLVFTGLKGVAAFNNTAGVLFRRFQYLDSINSVSFPDLQNLTTAYGMQNCFYGCRNLTSAYFPSLETVSGNYSLSYSFWGCSALTNIYLPLLTTVTGERAFQYAFQGCTGLTSVALQKLTTINNAGQAFYQTFYGCTGITTADLPELTTINNSGDALDSMFNGCSLLVSISVPKLYSITNNSGNALAAFVKGTQISSLSFPSLVSVNNSPQCFNQMVSGCTLLRNITFESLSDVNSSYCLYRGLAGITNASVYFYALDSSSFGTYTNTFSQMLYQSTDCTIHFPIRIQSTIGSWSDVTGGFGGTNTTVLFDIVTSLTGADSNTYTRQQKNSTSTATAWTYNDTLYYTSGTTEPQVGDTIYSDSACTTAVTTIDSIA